MRESQWRMTSTAIACLSLALDNEHETVRALVRSTDPEDLPRLVGHILAVAAHLVDRHGDRPYLDNLRAAASSRLLTEDGVRQ